MLELVLIRKIAVKAFDSFHLLGQMAYLYEGKYPKTTTHYLIFQNMVLKIILEKSYLSLISHMLNELIYSIQWYRHKTLLCNVFIISTFPATQF